MRRPLRKRQVASAAASGAVLSGSPETMVERAALERALTRLPDDDRTVFLLHEVKGYSHAEIAELLGIQRSVSTKRLYRARKLLRRLLRDRQ